MQTHLWVAEHWALLMAWALIVCIAAGCVFAYIHPLLSCIGMCSQLVVSPCKCLCRRKRQGGATTKAQDPSLTPLTPLHEHQSHETVYVLEDDRD